MNKRKIFVIAAIGVAAIFIFYKAKKVDIKNSKPNYLTTNKFTGNEAR